MDTTESQGIPYPSGTDFGNGARQMQDMAEYLEAQFNGLTTDWTARRTNPTWLVRKTSSQSIDSLASNDARGNLINFQVVDHDNTGYGMGPMPDAAGGLSVGGRGLWYIGGYALISGGTTSQARRRLDLLVTNHDLVSGLPSMQTFSHISQESLTSGEHMVVEALVVATDAELSLAASAEGSGTIVVNSGALLWATRICELE